MIAASGSWYAGLIETVDSMVELETVIEPGELVSAYRDGYGQFRRALEERRYLA